MAEEKEIIEGVELTAVDKLQDFYEKNGTVVNVVVIGLLLLVIGGLFYMNVWKPKKEVAAQEAIFMAQHYFELDSFALALNGSGFDGFVDVANNHGGTKAGNLANYYAGVCYYHLADYTNAVEYLGDFSTDDPIIGALGYNVMADAQMELGQADAALANYSKAANFSDNGAIAPVMILKAGMAYENQGKTAEAKEFYARIVEEFPTSDKVADAELLLNKLDAAQ
ncbi:MAG: tetratricopeptide repeat protein [Chitinophagales bacterium]